MNEVILMSVCRRQYHTTYCEHVGHSPCCAWVMVLLELTGMLGSWGIVDLLGPYELRQNSACKRRLVARRPLCFQGS